MEIEWRPILYLDIWIGPKGGGVYLIKRSSNFFFKSESSREPNPSTIEFNIRSVSSCNICSASWSDSVALIFIAQRSLIDWIDSLTCRHSSKDFSVTSSRLINFLSLTSFAIWSFSAALMALCFSMINLGVFKVIGAPSKYFCNSSSVISLVDSPGGSLFAVDFAGFPFLAAIVALPFSRGYQIQNPKGP